MSTWPKQPERDQRRQGPDNPFRLGRYHQSENQRAAVNPWWDTADLGKRQPQSQEHRADADSDGTVTQAERKAAHEAMRAQMAERREARRAERAGQ